MGVKACKVHENFFHNGRGSSLDGRATKLLFAVGK